MKPTSHYTVLHVADLDRAIEFYTQQLGFELGFKWGEPPFYAGVQNGDCCLHFSAKYPYKNNTGHGNIYLVFPEVDALYEKLKVAGVTLHCEIADQPYGMRDFSIADPDGNQVGIGAELQHHAD